MKKFYIKKSIVAKDIRDALRREKDSQVTEVYQDYSYVHVDTRNIGFTKNHGNIN